VNKPPNILKSKSSVVFYRLNRDGQADFPAASTLGGGILCVYDPALPWLHAMAPFEGWVCRLGSYWKDRFTAVSPLELLAAQ